MRVKYKNVGSLLSVSNGCCLDPEKVTIRKIRLDDLSGAAYLLRRTYAGTGYRENWTVKGSISYLKRFYLIEPGSCIAAVCGKKIIGALFAFRYPWNGVPILHVQELFVDRTKRHLGIGTALIMTVSKTLPGTYINLVSKKGAGVESFYSRLGVKADSRYRLLTGYPFFK